MAEHPDAGVVGGKILNLDGSIQPSIRSFPALFSQVIVLLKLRLRIGFDSLPYF
jgi:hypothetical protein